ncbi:MAG TPA: S8 family serine peptidase [Roseiflexaceae bacterium]|nr:S8 family serine peptidase [Roseiflexaceae bacterium]
MTPLNKFIALRKTPRAAALGLQSAATAEKRSEIVRDAEHSDRATELRAIGLPEIQPQRREGAEFGFERLGNVGVYVVTAVDQAQAQAARAVLEPDYLVMPNIPLSLPATALATRRLARRPAAPWPEASGVALARSRGLTGHGVLVGVLDTGVDADHAEFARRRIEFRYVPLDPAPEGMRAVRGFDVHGHGTHVCGIIAGRNVGVAPDVELMVAAVIESETVRTSLERIVIALDWMLSQFRLPEHQHKPMIVSMSLGFREDWISAPAYQTVTEGMRLLLATLVHDFDVLPVVAIGNDGPGQVRAPGYFAEALAVGAVDFEGHIWEHSGSGRAPDGPQKPDLVGYGVDVVSSLERDIRRRSIYAPMSGTSMATPYVTGIAALLAQASPGTQGAALRERLLSAALPLPVPPERVGAGLARYV